MAQISNEQEQNERVSSILKKLTQGKSREKIAEQLGYSTWKSLDNYMRRHGFTWDSKTGIYSKGVALVPPRKDIDSFEPGANPEEIVRLFSIGLIDAREVAKKMGFPGHKEMGAYMHRQGYVWSSKTLNYVIAATITDVDHPYSVFIDTHPKTSRTHTVQQATGVSLEDEKYKSLFDFLWQSKDKLIRLIESLNNVDQVRIFNIPGAAKTKSIFLSDALSKLMMTFCNQHNLSQRQGFEAALAEYLSRYGYQEKVDQLLSTANEEQES